MNVSTIIKMIRQESPVRMEMGTVISTDSRGIRQVTVRLSGGRTVSRLYVCVDDLKIGDPVIVAHMEGLDRMVVISRVLDDYSSDLAKMAVLAPPANLSVTGFPMAIHTEWEDYPGEGLSYIVEESDDAGATGTQMLVTQGSYYLHLCTVEADHEPETWHFRVRSLRWLGDNNVQYSGWSNWTSGTSKTWDERYYSESELSSADCDGLHGASLIWICDANGNFVSTVSNVEQALQDLAEGGGTPPVHDHSSGTEGGQNLRQLQEFEFDDATELTIAGGVITRTQTYHKVDTQADAGTDNLDTINGGTEGDLLVIRPESGARTVVVKHNTGNIWLSGASDVTLDDVDDHIALIYTGSKWCDIGAGSATSGSVPAAGNTGDMLVDDGAAWQRKTISQDLTVVSGGAATVRGIQTQKVSTTVPTKDQVLKWIVDASGCPGASTVSEFWAPSEIAHDELDGTQGGQADEYYHLTSAQHTAVGSMVSAGLAALTQAEVDQLENIGATTINAAQWGYVGVMDQSVATGASPTFATLTIGSGGAIKPTDASGQDLGDATHLWDLYTQYIRFAGTNSIAIPDVTNIALSILDDGAADSYLKFRTNAQKLVSINADGADIDFTVTGNGMIAVFNARSSDGQIIMGQLGAGHVASSAAGVLSASQNITMTDGAWIGIASNELLTVNAAENFTFSGITSLVVPNGCWIGADADCSWVFDSGNGDVTTQDNVGMGTTNPGARMEIANVIAGQYGLILQTDNAGRGFQVTTPDFTFNVAGSRLRMSMGAGAGDTHVVMQSEWKGTTPRVLALNPGGGRVSVGIAAPAASAIFELSSTTGALLLPRMTTVQRDALGAVNGMVIYNATTGAVEAYEGGAWGNL